MLPIENILFYTFSILAVISSLMVILSHNPVHSIFFLVFTFCNASALLILIEAEFLAMIFLIVYVGAIAVLFLFVIMMLNIRLHELKENISQYLPFGGFIGVIFLFELYIVLNTELISKVTYEGYPELPTLLNYQELIYKYDNISALGSTLFTLNSYLFILSSLILLVAMIAAIILTVQRNRFVHKQYIFQQTSRTFEKAILFKNKRNNYNNFMM